jgi:hypothetical protein
MLFSLLNFFTTLLGRVQFSSLTGLLECVNNTNSFQLERPKFTHQMSFTSSSNDPIHSTSAVANGYAFRVRTSSTASTNTTHFLLHLHHNHQKLSSTSKLLARGLGNCDMRLLRLVRMECHFH